MDRMSYSAADDRYDSMPYRYTGRSGLKLPMLSLGLWQNFGDDRDEDTQRAILRRAFDRGVTHFDLANNYGPPYGRAEENFGRYIEKDLAPYRDELVISTKAGYDMWPGPYGQGGGSRKYVLSSLDQSLGRMGLAYVDIFYSHRFDPDTPLEETISALDTAVRSGRALYAGISSYSPEKTREAATIARELGTPLLIHQPSYSCSTAGSRADCSTSSRSRAWAASCSPHSRRGCSPTATSTGCPGTREPPARTPRWPVSRTTCSDGCVPSTRSPSGAARSSPSSRSSGRCATPGSPRR